MRIEKMKKNPRDEDLYTILQRKLSGKKIRDKVLQGTIECEELGVNNILMVNTTSGWGFKVRVINNPLGEGLLPIKISKIRVLKTEDDWKLLTESIGECKNTRVLKNKHIVFIECLEPEYSINELLNYLDKNEKIIMECYYEPWEK